MNDQLPIAQIVVGAGAALALLVIVIELVRTRKLSIQYSVLWVATSGAALAFVSTYSYYYKFAHKWHFTPLSLAFFVALVVLTLVMLFLCVRLTKVDNDLRNLVQRLAIETARRAGRQEGAVTGDKLEEGTEDRGR